MQIYWSWIGKNVVLLYWVKQKCTFIGLGYTKTLLYWAGKGENWPGLGKNTV